MHPRSTTPNRPAAGALRSWRGAFCLAALATLVGCSTLPTAPRTGDRSAAPGGLVHGTLEPGSPSGQPAGILPMDTLVKDLGPVTEPTDTLLEISKIIMGDDGGEVKNGAFAVELPAGAIDGTAQVGIRLNPVDALSCELTITPLSANGFAKPVLLTVDCTGILHLERYGILWLNEATGEWVEMGSTVDTKEGTVSAELEHFSHYKVAEVLKEGKAGW